MICTNIYTCLFGVPEWKGQTKQLNGESKTVDRKIPSFEGNRINYGRVVCQIIDIAAPLVLIVLGILGSCGVLNMSTAISYSMLSVGSVLTLANILILLHHKWGQCRAPKKDDEPSNFTTQAYVNRAHLTFGVPYGQNRVVVLDVNSFLDS